MTGLLNEAVHGTFGAGFGGAFRSPCDTAVPSSGVLERGEEGVEDMINAVAPQV